MSSTSSSSGRQVWGTVLTAEETINGSFGGAAAEAPDRRDHYRRYGILREPVYAWGRFVDRFDLDKEPNEPNRFGWICEIDPYDPDSVPVKRTALGRFKHECCTMALCPDGRVAFYSGDDERFEYIYKFVTARPWNPQDRAANRDLLDEGTLFVGRFDDDGKVGPIGGIQMKTVGARDKGAEYFLTPADNCASAAEDTPEGLTLVKVDTIDAAALESLRRAIPAVAGGAVRTFPVLGPPLPGIEVAVRDEHGRWLGDREVGVLHLRGPNVMSGYLHYANPGVLEPPKSELGPGWYDTGDIVDIDADGFLHILGRVKRFAKIAGEMISLEVVEKIAMAASPGFQHAASSRPDTQRGEALVLFTTDPALTRERLQQAAQTLGLPELAVPRRLHAVSAIPLLGTGKVNYAKLKEDALALATAP